MNTIDLSVDFNGILLFDPDRLKDFYGGSIEEGSNLWKTFTSTEDGNIAMERGILVPILGINDGFYPVTVRHDDEQSTWKEIPIRINGTFPLYVEKRLVLADMSILWDWEDELGWHNTSIAPGYYGVTINGYRVIEENIVTKHGYEFVLKRESDLPKLTASIGANMQVLTLED
jgi:hypothetical protein